ncbi:MAG: hypothetical protein IIX40_06200 [Alistipes sp.]|nr:hypothetical protein [Alistipes sp.]
MITDPNISFDQIAEDFVARKQSKYYNVRYTSEIDLNTDILLKLTDEQVAEMKAIAAKCEAEEISLLSYFESHEVPSYLNIGDEYYYTLRRPISAELDTPLLYCRFQVLYFPDGFDCEHCIEDIDITLSATDYIALLKWQMEWRNGSFINLLKDLPDIAQRINAKLSNHIYMEDETFNVGCYPAIIILKQIRDEVFDLLGENDEYADIFIESTDEASYYISFNIERNSASMIYYSQSCDIEAQCYHYQYTKLYDIDADELKRVFDVVTHKELVEVVNERYGSKEGLALFQGMLDKEQIAYKIDND